MFQFRDEALERHLLGLLMLQQDYIPLVEPEVFYVTANAQVFRKMAELAGEGKKVSPAILASHLPGISASYVSGMTDGVPETSRETFDGVLARLRELLHKRQIYIATADIQKALKADDLEGVDRILDELKQAEPKLDDIGALTADDLVTAHEEYSARGGGITCGIPALDALTGGIGEGEVAVLEGAAKVAKSAFAQNWLRHFARTYPQFGAIFFSFEMPAAQLGERLLMIDLQKGRDDLAALTAEEKAEVKRRHGNIFHIVKPMGLRGIYNTIQRLRFKSDIKFVIIDFLTRIPTDCKDEYDAIRIATKAIKDMAKSLGVAILVLSQVGRGNDQWRPLNLRSGRGSGTIEEDADFIFGVYRPELNPDMTFEDKFKWSGIIMFQVLGSRRTDTIPDLRLNFSKRSLRITQLDVPEQEEPKP